MNIDSQDPKLRKPSTPRANKGKAVKDLSKGRICSSCNLYKDRENFFAHPSGFNGLGPRCKECISVFYKTPQSKSVKKALYNKRKDSHECVRCGSSELVNNVFCKSCWFESQAANFGGMKQFSSLLELWESQNGRCFYSDEVLIPGFNASLDHQVPKSRGGSDEISNLKWVHIQINLMKSDMTHEEFLIKCQKIVNRFNT